MHNVLQRVFDDKVAVVSFEACLEYRPLRLSQAMAMAIVAYKLYTIVRLCSLLTGCHLMGSNPQAVPGACGTLISQQLHIIYDGQGHAWLVNVLEWCAHHMV
jgi:hypothetical protein